MFKRIFRKDFSRLSMLNEKLSNFKKDSMLNGQGNSPRGKILQKDLLRIQNGKNVLKNQSLGKHSSLREKKPSIKIFVKFMSCRKLRFFFIPFFRISISFSIFYLKNKAKKKFHRKEKVIINLIKKNPTRII